MRSLIVFLALVAFVTARPKGPTDPGTKVDVVDNSSPSQNVIDPGFSQPHDKFVIDPAFYQPHRNPDLRSS